MKNSDIIRADRVKDIYKEKLTFVAQTALTKALTTIPMIIANKQIPQQEIEHKANTNKFIQSLFHIGKKLYNTTTLKVFQFLSIYLPIWTTFSLEWVVYLFNSLYCSYEKTLLV